jgi:probable HAF family extracellular repeat protein
MYRRISFSIVFILCVINCDITQAIVQYTVTDLGTLGGTESKAYGVNDSGQVVGYADTTGNAARHAFFYSGSTMTDLGTLGGSFSQALGINYSGQIVGVAGIAGNVSDHAFRYSGSTMTNMGTLGGTDSSASCINTSGQIVGWSETTNNAAQHAFLYNGSTMKDLNTLIDSSSGWTLQYAQDINNTGQIAGAGLINGHSHAFLLTPVPEPSTCMLLGSTLLGLGWVASVRRRMAKK